MTRLDPKPIPLITWDNMAPPFDGHTYFENREHFPFEPDIEPFSLVNAWWLMEAALLAYAGEGFAVAHFEAAGFDDVRFFTGHSTQCYLAANRRFAILAFRGTECGIGQGPEAMAQFIADLGVDVDIRRIEAKAGARIHRGFHNALDEIWRDLSPCLDALSDRDCPLWATGHSLGGALAVLTAARLGKAQGLYTFGAPRLGNRKFSSNFPIELHRFANNNDLVPHLPPFPYTDLGELHYIDRHGNLQKNLDLWQRLKDEIKGHIDCLAENTRNLKQGWIATLPDGIKDHTPLLYALHIWNNLVSSTE